MGKFVIIVAGGSGSRMKTKVPKQFLELDGRPVLMHTIEQFFNFDPSIGIVLVLPQDQVETWETLCVHHTFQISCKIAIGGSSRFESVKSGLSQIEADKGTVAIHDGVRPFVSFETLTRCFDMAEEKGNAVPIVPLVESIRTITDEGSMAADRNRYVLVQTPQVFDLEEIRNAYSCRYNPIFTDDASVLEYAGKSINLVAGNRENIKITEPIDFEIAKSIITYNKRKK